MRWQDQTRVHPPLAGDTLLEEQRAAAERQAIVDAQAEEIRGRYGLPPAQPERSPEEIREESHRAEMAVYAAPRLTKEQLDEIDPHSAVGKARALAEINLRDPNRRAAHALPPIPDAMDVEAGRVDRQRNPAHVVEMAKREAIIAATEERRSVFSRLTGRK